MKYYPVLFLLALVFCIGSCSPSRKLQPPSPPSNSFHLPDTLPRLPVSEVDLPVKIYVRPLLVIADSLVPKEFVSDRWPDYLPASCDFRYKYRFVRSGFTLSCSNNKLGVRLTGSYQVAGSRCVCTFDKPVSPWISGSCGFGKEPMRKVDISISSLLNFLPNYQIRTFSRLDQLKATDRCIVSMLSTDMTQQILDSIQSSIAAFCSTLDETIAGMDFSAYLRQEAAKAWQKTAIGNYGYLVVNPVAIRVGQLNYAKDTLSISVGLSCQPEFSSDSSNRPFVPPLPPLSAADNRNGVSLYLNAVYDYQFISKLLNDTLRNRSFVVKGRTVIIKDVVLKGIGGHQVEMKVDFAGTRKGRIYLRGTPILDTAKQTLSIPDISYSLESKDLALKIARSLLRNKIRKSIQGNSYLDIAALVKTNLPVLDAQLNRQLAPNAYSNGKTMELRLLGMLAGEKELQVQFFIKANLSLTGTGLPK